MTTQKLFISIIFSKRLRPQPAGHQDTKPSTKLNTKPPSPAPSTTAVVLIVDLVLTHRNG